MKRTIFFACLLIALTGACLSQTWVSGPVSGVWDASGSPYYVDSEIFVPTGGTLIIDSGCEVIFTFHYAFSVDTGAVLKALGTLMAPITFFPSDTTFWSPGWNGIRFYNASDACSLVYCEIAYGQAYGFSYEDSCGGGVYCDNSNPTISHCTIRNNLANNCGGGIYANYSDPLIADNSIIDNYDDGIYCTSSYSTISDNIIDNNTGNGIYCSGDLDISDNTITENSGYGIWSSNGASNITNNSITGNDADGIHARSGGPVHISGNTISDNSENGVDNDIVGCLMSIYGNTICDNAGRGINYDPMSCDTTSICDNAIFGNLGGGIHHHGGGYIFNNQIYENSVIGSGLDGGGGIYIWGDDLYVYDNVITNNYTNTGDHRSGGGGIYCVCMRGTVTITNNIITGNEAGHGGGIFTHVWNWGGAVITANRISGNIAEKGAGIYLTEDEEGVIANNIITDNTATGDGGGVYCLSPWPFFYGNTIVDNMAANGRGIYFGNDKQGIFNCIVVNDGTSGGEIYVDSGCSLCVACCNIDSIDVITAGSATVSFGPGNIFADPLFADTLCHLSASSPCINAGFGAVYMPTYDEIVYPDSTDYDGDIRPLSGGWDIGADEYDSAYTPPTSDALAILVNNSAAIWHTCALGRAYMVCLDNGFDYDDIYVLHIDDTWDIDLNSTNDVDGLCSEANLENAFETWAPSLAGPTTKLYVFFTGLGGVDNYATWFPPSGLSSTELNDLFDSYSAAAGTDSIFFIYNAGKSGSFIDELSAPGRIIMTSTDSSLASWFIGGIFFPHLVFNKLAIGNSFMEAFNFAADVIGIILGDSYQIPMLDDNGDGIGHTDPLPAGGDGVLSALIEWESGSRRPFEMPVITVFNVDTSSFPDSILLHVETSIEIDSCWVYALRQDTTYQISDTCGVDIVCDGVVDVPIALLINTSGLSYDGSILRSELRGSYLFAALAQAQAEPGDPFGEFSAAEPAGFVYEGIPDDGHLPVEFSMTMKPNPFNSAVSISAPECAEIEIFDVNGRLVYEIPVGARSQTRPSPNNGNRDMETGGSQTLPYEITWSPDKSLGSGIYLVRVKSGDKDITKRVVYLK